MSLETRGNRPSPDERGPVAALMWPILYRDYRTRMSIQVFHGNSWSGWFENGNPHGDHRPGPPARPTGIRDSKLAR